MKPTRTTVLPALAAAVAAACGPSTGEIRSAALAGDTPLAVSLADRDPESLQAVAFGVLERLRADRTTVGSARRALESAPVTALPLLERWADDESADVRTRTFARAKVRELTGEAFSAELHAALDDSDGEVRAFALRGLAADLPAERLVAALHDPPVSAVAAVALARRAAREPLDPTAAAETLHAFRSDLPAGTRAVLAGVLDAAAPDARDALAEALDDSAPGVRRAAAAALARSTDPTRDPRLAAILADTLSVEGLAVAVEAARQGRADVLADYLERLLLAGASKDALAAGGLLAFPGGGDDVAAKALESGGDAARLAACQRLLAVDPDRADCVALLDERIAGDDALSALVAAELLFEHGHARGLDRLRSLAEHAEPRIRARVMQVAAARRFDADLLGRGMTDPDPDVAAAAAVAALKVPDPYTARMTAR
jgi:hypothetical protein